jgi:diguanylate cyclase (GGDEF)-like protein
MRVRPSDIYAAWPAPWVLAAPITLAAYLLATNGHWLSFGLLALGGAGLIGALLRYRRTRRDLLEAERSLSARDTELQTLHAIGREIVSSLRPERIFAVLERECRKIFEFECCLIALLDRSTETLYAAYRHRRRRVTELSRDLPIHRLARWAHQEKRGKRVDDVRVLPSDSPLRGEWLAPGTRSALVAPLIVDGELIGVLSLQSEQTEAYDDRQLALLITIAQQAALAAESARRYELATVDSLTGLYVRDYFFARLEEEDERARRYGGIFAVLMLDLDGFKEINDRNGHLAGDQFLREISATVREQLRAADIACRFGGDEFCLLLPQTALDGARAIAERIRNAVSRRIVSIEGLALRTTVSIGLAVFPDHDAGDLRSLMRKADEALYRAKRAGRDRVVPSAA